MSNQNGDKPMISKVYSLMFYYILQLTALICLHVAALILFYWNIQPYAYMVLTMATTADVVILGISSRSQEAVKTEVRLDKMSDEMIRTMKMTAALYNELLNLVKEFIRKPKEVR